MESAHNYLSSVKSSHNYLQRPEQRDSQPPLDTPPLPPGEATSIAAFQLAPTPPPPLPDTSANDHSKKPRRTNNIEADKKSSVREMISAMKSGQKEQLPFYQNHQVAPGKLELPSQSPPPPPPPRRNLSNPALEKQPSMENLMSGPDEIDFGEENEQDKIEKRERMERLNRTSMRINFEQAKIDDFEDLDTLLDNLHETIRRKNTQEQKAPILPEKPPGKSLKLSSESAEEEKVRVAMEKLKEANLKRTAARVCIKDQKVFKTIMVNSLMSANEVVETVKTKFHLPENPDWTLFEIENEWEIERPIRDFEKVVDIFSTWGHLSSNVIMVKKYGFRESLTAENAFDTFPRMCGWMWLRTKPKKWIRRFFELKSNSICYSKDTTGKDEKHLAYLKEIDVYTLTNILKHAPAKFCFAVKFQSNPRSFGEADEYCHFFAVDKIDKMKDWVLSIRAAKTRSILENMPQSMKHIPKESASRELSTEHNSQFDEPQYSGNKSSEIVSNPPPPPPMKPQKSFNMDVDDSVSRPPPPPLPFSTPSMKPQKSQETRIGDSASHPIPPPPVPVALKPTTKFVNAHKGLNSNNPKPNYNYQRNGDVQDSPVPPAPNYIPASPPSRSSFASSNNEEFDDELKKVARKIVSKRQIPPPPEHNPEISPPPSPSVTHGNKKPALNRHRQAHTKPNRHNADIEDLSKPKKNPFRNPPPTKAKPKPTNEKFSSFPKHQAARVKDGALVTKIGMKQGKLLEEEGEMINQTQFGKEGKPLVPLTKGDLGFIPGIKLNKYDAAKPKQKPIEHKKCDACGCCDFARNPFREKSCANCFHVH